VPAEVLDPKRTWADKQAYDQTARELSARFATNFKQFEPYVTDAVKAAAIHGAT
jgi:phosphoenolpyruvate carboxykinase (ATP)